MIESTSDTIIPELESFCDAIPKKKGHKHLYNRFDKLLKNLNKIVVTPKEELVLGRIVSVFCCEIVYFVDLKGFSDWVSRCYLCANELVPFFSEDEGKLQIQKLKIAYRVMESCKIKQSFMSNSLSKRDIKFSPAEYLFLVNLYFKASNDSCHGRGFCQELHLYNNFMCGYQLARDYLKDTSNYKIYEEWFGIINPLHLCELKRLIRLPRIRMGNWYNWDGVEALITETLTLQIEMLEDWKSHSPESFYDFGGEELLSKCLEY